jgi:hypothetical protein
MALATTVGKSTIRPLGDPDYIYASEPQFRITRDGVTGTWSVAPVPEAVNPTYLDGRALKKEAPLRNGALLSVGPTRLKLSVAIRTN